MSGPASSAPARTHTVIVYSDDPKVRDTVRTALGRRPAPDLGRVEYVEAAQDEELIRIVDRGGVDLVVLDGEAWPAGGMGLSKQMKDELDDCPPTIVLIARRDDAWLASWSLADAVLTHPVDAFELVEAASALLRQREAGAPVRRAIGR